MKKKSLDWSTNPENKITVVQRLLSPVSLRVREKQFGTFWKLIKPTKKSTVLDVGVRADETLSDSNFFEKRYPFKKKLIALSIEDCSNLQRLYPKITFKKIMRNRSLPFRNKQFDVVVSWATLEHVGTRREQKNFLSELFRVGKKVFITTPNKMFFYDPHTNLFFIHWLPRKYFTVICNLLGKGFWAKIENFNPLGLADVKKVLPYMKGIQVVKFISICYFPSHLIISKTNEQ